MTERATAGDRCASDSSCIDEFFDLVRVDRDEADLPEGGGAHAAFHGALGAGLRRQRRGRGREKKTHPRLHEIGLGHELRKTRAGKKVLYFNF